MMAQWLSRSACKGREGGRGERGGRKKRNKRRVDEGNTVSPPCCLHPLMTSTSRATVTAVNNNDEIVIAPTVIAIIAYPHLC